MSESGPEAPPSDIAEIDSYHAHIYYDVTATKPHAAWLRARVEERFRVQMGRWHDVAVGPHTRPMYQIAFNIEIFPALVPFLMLNRGGLSILVHPNTDHPRDDHLLHALWLGEMLPLRAERLDISLAAAGRTRDVVAPNTNPGS